MQNNQNNTDKTILTLVIGFLIVFGDADHLRTWERGRWGAGCGVWGAFSVN
jgi:hypothetical protein